MVVSVAKDVEDFLREQVRSGACADVNELVNDLLRSLRDQRQTPFDLTPELEAWLLDAADKPATRLTSHDFDSIRRRVRARTKSSPA
jgi:Arc/MetJ-type ribon-helix-helix transcriptional regulator